MEQSPLSGLKKKLFIDDSILQSNDSSNFTSNILDTDRFISRKL
jgi:hypothetical protein